jgi:ABC-type sulfate/molybdate transport systems ATPase subunit
VSRAAKSQRVALARALVTEPRGLLLDEPFAALDITARRRLREVLAAHLSQVGVPTLIVTHDVRDAAALGANICALEGGHVAQWGTLEQLRCAPRSPFVTEFVGADLAELCSGAEKEVTRSVLTDYNTMASDE